LFYHARRPKYGRFFGGVRREKKRKGGEKRGKRRKKRRKKGGGRRGEGEKRVWGRKEGLEMFI
jgi:hypothetical protein